MELTVERPPRFVSRGGEKLAHALDALGVDPAGKDCLDLGASTGGFTDCLLQRGAARVIALDVGYGQLHPRLRDDARVTVLERVNARHLAERVRTGARHVRRVVHRRRVLPAGDRARRARLGGSSSSSPSSRPAAPRCRKASCATPVHRRVLRAFCAEVAAWHARVAGVVDSGHPGPKGNREFVVHLIASEEPSDPDELERRIEPPSGSGAPVARATLVTHGRTEQVGDGVERLVAVAERSGVELLVGPDEAARHGLTPRGDTASADLVVVLGGDGTMLVPCGAPSTRACP